MFVDHSTTTLNPKLVSACQSGLSCSAGSAGSAGSADSAGLAGLAGLILARLGLACLCWLAGGRRMLANPVAYTLSAYQVGVSERQAGRWS